MTVHIQVDVKGFFTTHHYFDIDTGTWGLLTIPAFSDQGTFHRADGHKLVMRKVHWLGSAYELVDGKLVRGSADRRSLFSRDFLIEFDGNQYLLEPEGWLSEGWTLSDAWSNCLVMIRPRGILRQGAHLTITGHAHADLVAFAYYLVYVRGQEDAAAAAAVTGTAAS